MRVVRLLVVVFVTIALFVITVHTATAQEAPFWIESYGVKIRSCPSVTCPVVSDAVRSPLVSYLEAGNKAKVLAAVPAQDDAGCVVEGKCTWYQIGEGYVYAPYTRRIPAPRALLGLFCPEETCIVVDLTTQSTHVIRNGRDVYRTWVSTGSYARTPVGQFRVGWQLPTRRMTGGVPGTGSYYDLAEVPSVTYFTGSGHAFHGTYWHNRFGIPQSHGCINMTAYDATVVYEYAPRGTLVVIGNNFPRTIAHPHHKHME